MNDLDYFTNPDWLRGLVAWQVVGLSAEELIKTSVRIATASAKNGGGPFGAVIAEASGRIVEIGWNWVVAAHDSTLHAEVHCIRRAQRLLKTHNLGAPGLPALTLYSSCDPCIQCFGAIYWSGLKKVYACAGKADAEAAGFDEGPLMPEMWALAKKRKGIDFIPCFCFEESALEPFRAFAAVGGRLY